RGTYDRQLGEDFPLVVRGEVSLVGAGMGKTAIVGLGRYDAAPSGGSAGYQAQLATLVVGDARARIEVAELSLDAGAGAAMDGVGVLCTRGNLEDFYHDLKEGYLPANTVLRAVATGPHFVGGVVVASETVPVSSGCNLRLESSRVVGGQFGAWA